MPRKCQDDSIDFDVASRDQSGHHAAISHSRYWDTGSSMNPTLVTLLDRHRPALTKCRRSRTRRSRSERTNEGRAASADFARRVVSLLRYLRARTDSTGRLILRRPALDRSDAHSLQLSTRRRARRRCNACWCAGRLRAPPRLAGSEDVQLSRPPARLARRPANVRRPTKRFGVSCSAASERHRRLGILQQQARSSAMVGELIPPAVELYE